MLRRISDHRWKARALAGLLAAGSPWAAPVVQAQTSSGASSRARVDELLARGIQSRDAGRDAEALDFYRQAVALEPENPRVLAHLGATYHALGRWVSAHTYLLQALQYGDDPYIQRHASGLRQPLTLVADHIGFLEVYGAPAGAQALLNGQPVAALPMSTPVPVTVGSYMLEVRLADHYTLARPVAITPRQLTREEVELAPHRDAAPEVTGAPAAVGTPPPRALSPQAPAARPSDSGAEEATSRGANYWPWVFGGLGAAAAITSVVAWERREHYAARFNGDDCIGVGVSRGERCGSDLDRGQRAETVMWVGGIATGAFAAATVLGIVLASPEEASEGASLRCAPGVLGAVCMGTF